MISSEKEATDLRKLQLAELGILKEAVRICEKNNIRYFLLGGTFLGAVRHKGFIPWDDDIDIGLPRPDYERLIGIVQDELPRNLIYRNFRTGSEDTIYFSRIENPAISVEDRSASKNKLRSAWIDIFPLDGMPNNVLLRQLRKLHLLYRRLMLQYSSFDTIVNLKRPNRPLHERILINLGLVLHPEKHLDTAECLEKLDKALKRCDYDDSEYVVNFMGAHKFKEMFPKSVYEETAEYEFEGEKYIAPKDYDKVLSQMYGEYMNEPGDDEKNRHRIRMIDTKPTEKEN